MRNVGWSMSACLLVACGARDTSWGVSRFDEASREPEQRTAPVNPSNHANSDTPESDAGQAVDATVPMDVVTDAENPADAGVFIDVTNDAAAPEPGPIVGRVVYLDGQG